MSIAMGQSKYERTDLGSRVMACFSTEHLQHVETHLQSWALLNDTTINP